MGKVIKKKYYAVAEGPVTGIYHTSWDEARPNIHGHKVVFKGFEQEKPAKSYLKNAGYSGDYTIRCSWPPMDTVQASPQPLQVLSQAPQASTSYHSQASTSYHSQASTPHQPNQPNTVDAAIYIPRHNAEYSIAYRVMGRTFSSCNTFSGMDREEEALSHLLNTTSQYKISAVKFCGDTSHKAIGALRDKGNTIQPHLDYVGIEDSDLTKAAADLSIDRVVSNSQWYSQHRAVVVGINDYQKINGLSYCTNDATEMGRFLERCGFQVVSLLNEKATKQRIEEELYDANRTMNANGRFVVFFAGHGGSGNDTKLASFKPVDYDPDKPNSTGIPLEGLPDKIAKTVPAKHILLILDCCYSGYGLNRSEYLDQYNQYQLTENLKSKCIAILTAGKDTETVIEKNGHGIFTAKLLEGLNGEAFNKKPWISVLSLSNWLHEKLGQEHQTTQYNRLGGQGYFIFERSGRQSDPAAIST